VTRSHGGQGVTALDGPPWPEHVLRRRRTNARTGATGLGAWLARRHGVPLRPGPHGLLVAVGYPRRFPVAGAGAVCVGDVVLVREAPGVHDVADVLARRPRLLDHEARHAAQWARWGGPVLFLPAYALATAWSWWRTGDRHSANGFERAAGLLDGGYREAATLPVTRSAAAVGAGLRSAAAGLLRRRDRPGRPPGQPG
jgi:hypothetical protein